MYKIGNEKLWSSLNDKAAEQRLPLSTVVAEIMHLTALDALFSLAVPEKAALDFIYIQRQNGFQPALDEWNWESLDKNKLEDFMTVFPKSVQNHFQKYKKD